MSIIVHMAVVRKTLVTLGTHKSADGDVVVTPERVGHWIDTKQRMAAAGIKVPIPWGHQKRAVPGHADDPDHKAYLASRYNAGYHETFERGPEGELIGVMDLPGLTPDAAGNLIDPQTGTAIREVSIGIDNFTDGSGRVWPDAIVHTALTPWPVWAGQDGFQALGLQHEPTSAYRCLSLKMGATQMAFPPSDKKTDEPPNPDKKTDATPPADATGNDLLAPPAGPTLMAQCQQALAELGVVMPDNTQESPEKFLEHLLTALSVKKGAAQQQPSTTPPAQNGTPNPAANGTPQAQPMYMSLRDYTASPPAMREFIDRQHRTLRDDLVKEMDGLVKLGCPPHLVAKFKAEMGSGAMIGLSLKTMSLEGSLPDRVKLIKEVLTALPESARNYLALAKGEPVPNPARADEVTQAEFNAQIECRLNRLDPTRTAKAAS